MKTVIKMNIKIKKTHNKKANIANFLMDESKMEKNQKINCTVSSCKYNDEQRQKCNLETIIVTPVQGGSSTEPDESQCSSYECE